MEIEWIVLALLIITYHCCNRKCIKAHYKRCFIILIRNNILGIHLSAVKDNFALTLYNVENKGTIKESELMVMQYITGVIQEFPAFQGLTKESLCTLERCTSLSCFQGKKILFEERKRIDFLYFLLRGHVSIYKMNTNGQKKVMFIIGRGEFINEDMIEQMPSVVSAEIFERAELFVIPKDIVWEIMQKDTVFAKHLYESLSMKARRLYRQLIKTPSSITMEKRLAAKLYRLGKDYGTITPQGIEIALEISITYLADLLGSQRETISRCIKDMQQEQLIVYDKKRFTILDLPKLVKYYKTS